MLVMATLLMTSCFGVGGADGSTGDTGNVTTATPTTTTTTVTPSPTPTPTPTPTRYIYNDFTPAEKSLFTQYIGEIIPFLPNDEYYVEGYYDEDDYEHGICFYTFGNTKSDFTSYRQLYASYTLTETYRDDEGDTWYRYEKDDVVVDLSFYYYYGSSVVDVYVYSSLSTDLDDDDDNGGGTADRGDVELITNKGKGLPQSDSGIFDVDFTKADNVKNVTDQGYYLDGCPTKGSPAVLVIPVEFRDIRATSKGYTTDKLETAFNGAAGSTDYCSVSEYYRQSSYGKLTLDITVLDFWFCPSKNSSVYASAYDDSGNFIGDQMILDEALAYLDTLMDLSEFDSDGNHVIDAVILVNTLDIGEDDFHWAYRYWNSYTDNAGYYYEYDGVSANDYIWASYQFLYDAGYSDDGDMIVDDNVLNTYTFIHEFGHVLGADDYYDTSYTGSPMAGCDIMDSMTGDHNAYTKFNFGWITTSKLIVTDTDVTLKLNDFSSSGDTVILANNWDVSLGAYQEYYIVVYYTGTGLNGGEYGYFTREGLLVYHVNAVLYKEIYDETVYYDVYNTNTDASDEYGTEDNLIELIPSAKDAYTYVVGDTLPEVVDDFGDTLAYTFVVDALTASTATVTFTKR